MQYIILTTIFSEYSFANAHFHLLLSHQWIERLNIHFSVLPQPHKFFIVHSSALSSLKIQFKDLKSFKSWSL